MILFTGRVSVASREILEMEGGLVGDHVKHPEGQVRGGPGGDERGALRRPSRVWGDLIELYDWTGPHEYGLRRTSRRFS